MRIVKHIALGAALVTGAFSAVLYTSCSKDASKSLYCHGQSNAGGVCSCKPGISGITCETTYRNLYAGVYKGNTPGNVGHGVGGNSLSFAYGVEDTLAPNYFNNMSVRWQDTGSFFVVMPIVLSSHTPAGSAFTVTATTVGSKTYTGNGNVSTNMASMALTETDTSGVVNYYTFNNFYKQ